jgi:hypothetical protein
VIDFGVKSSGEAYADTLPPFLKDAIARHDVLVGMDRKMVLATMGAPQSKIRELVPGTTDRHYEEWIYGQMPQTVRFVRFEGDRVTQVRTAAMGQPIAVRDQDEMQGYLGPDDTREVAMGDGKPGSHDESSAAPPTILKPGERAPGASQRVQYPVTSSTPPPDKAGGVPTPVTTVPPVSVPAQPLQASTP